MHVITTKVVAYKTPDEWLPAAAQCTQWINRLTRRGDLAVNIGPDAAEESKTAQYMQISAEIELRTSVLLNQDDPSKFALDDRLWKLRNAAFIGAFAHEAGHSVYSVAMPIDMRNARWGVDDSEKYTGRELDVLSFLEESRIERQLLSRRPELKMYMRRMALEIVNKDFKVADTRYGASVGAALTVARVDAGSVSRAAGKRFGKLLREVLSFETLVELRKLWKEFQAIDVTSLAKWPHEQTKRIASDWIKLVVDEDEEEHMHDLASIQIAVMMGGDPGDPDDGKLSDKMEQIAREESIDADTELGEEIREEVEERRVAEKRADMERKKEGRSEAETAFKRGTNRHGYSRSSRRGRNIEHRSPTSEERSAATILSRELAKVTTHDKIVTRTSSILPPGRVRGKAAVLGAAQLSREQQITAEPFAIVRRKHVDTDKIRVGVMLDVSGSMASATEPLGVMNWIFSNAVTKVDGKFCSILFGEHAEGMVRPGQKMDQVAIADACDGHENFEPAAKATDAELDLLDGNGTRVLVILTDAHFVMPDAAKYATAFMSLCKRRGVTVIWGHWRTFRQNYGHGEVIDMDGLTPTQVANKIGKEIVKAVRRTQMGMGMGTA